MLWCARRHEKRAAAFIPFWLPPRTFRQLPGEIAAGFSLLAGRIWLLAPGIAEHRWPMLSGLCRGPRSLDAPPTGC